MHLNIREFLPEIGDEGAMSRRLNSMGAPIRSLPLTVDPFEEASAFASAISATMGAHRS
jgi:hypothetical protein